MEEKIIIKAEFFSLNFLVIIFWIIFGITFMYNFSQAILLGGIYILLTGILSSMPSFLIAILLKHILNKRELIVTNKRVILRGAFSFRIDIPIEKITNVSMSFLYGIGCGGASARIHILFCKNKSDVFDVIISQTLQRDKKYINSQKE